MDLNRRRKFLWITGALLTLAACGAIAGGILLPYASPPPVAASSSSGGIGAAVDIGPPPLESFERVWDIDYRRPLGGGAPLVQPIVATTKPITLPLTSSLDFKLTGTVIEAGHSMAIFAKPDGRTELRQVGERAGNAEVLQIDNDRVTVRVNGQRIVLNVLKGQKG